MHDEESFTAVVRACHANQRRKRTQRLQSFSIRRRSPNTCSDFMHAMHRAETMPISSNWWSMLWCGAVRRSRRQSLGSARQRTLAAQRTQDEFNYLQDLLLQYVRSSSLVLFATADSCVAVAATENHIARSTKTARWHLPRGQRAVSAHQTNQSC